jgi:hypothetical protein
MFNFHILEEKLRFCMKRDLHFLSLASGLETYYLNIIIIICQKKFA